MRLRHASSAMLFAMLLVFAAVGPTAAAQQSQPPLAADQVEDFIASYPEARELADEYELDERSASGSAAAPNEVFGGVIADMKAVGAYDAFDALVRKHGFSGPEDWVGTANRIMVAYAIMKAEDAQGGGRVDQDMARKLAEARRQIQASDMRPEQKRRTLEELEAVASQMKMFEVPEGDRETVRPYMTELDGIVEEK